MSKYTGTKVSRRAFFGGLIVTALLCGDVSHAQSLRLKLRGSSAQSAANVVTMNATPVAPPALDTSLQGDGSWKYPAGGGFLEAEHIRIGPHPITGALNPLGFLPIGADVGGAGNYIEKVIVYNHLGVGVELTKKAVESVYFKMKGFWPQLVSAPGFGGGEVTVVADLCPRHGYRTRVTWTGTLDTAGALPVPLRYVAPGGSNTTGDGTIGNPWADPLFGMQQMTAANNGGILYCAPGTGGPNNDTWVFSTNPTTTVNSRKVTVAPMPGYTRADVKFTWADRALSANSRGAGVWSIPLSDVSFYEITFLWDTLEQIRGRETANTAWIDFHHCDHVDPNGVCGPIETGDWLRKGGAKSAAAPLLGIGYYNYNNLQNSFRHNEGQKYSARECNFEKCAMTGLHLVRNVNGKISFDVVYVDQVILGGANTMNNIRFVKSKIAVDNPFPQRRHNLPYVTLAEAVFDGQAATGGTGGMTYVAFNEQHNGTTVLLATNPNNQPFSAAKWMDGPNATSGLDGGSRSSGSGANDEAAAWGGAHLVSMNRTVTPTYSGAALSSTGHRMCVNAAVTTGASGLPNELSPNTTYYVVSTGFSANGFQIAATRGGAPITLTGGTGSVALTMTGMIVEGDFSTATGSSAVGNRLYIYIINHSDLAAQIGTQTPLGPSSRGIFMEDVFMGGEGAGNIALFQASNAMPIQPGTIEFYGDGTQFRTTSLMSCVPGDDFLKITTAGANKGLYARIVSYNTSTLEGVVSAVFPIVSGLTYGVLKSNHNTFFNTCWFYTATSGALFQLGDPVYNFCIRDCFIGSGDTAAAFNVAAVAFRNSITATPPNRGACDGLSIVDSILEAFEPEGPTPTSNNGAVFSNLRVRRGVSPGTGNQGAVTMNSTTHKIVSGTSIPTITVTVDLPRWELTPPGTVPVPRITGDYVGPFG